VRPQPRSHCLRCLFEQSPRRLRVLPRPPIRSLQRLPSLTVELHTHLPLPPGTVLLRGTCGHCCSWEYPTPTLVLPRPRSLLRLSPPPGAAFAADQCPEPPRCSFLLTPKHSSPPRSVPGTNCAFFFFFVDQLDPQAPQGFRPSVGPPGEDVFHAVTTVSFPRFLLHQFLSLSLPIFSPSSWCLGPCPAPVIDGPALCVLQRGLLVELQKGCDA